MKDKTITGTLATTRSGVGFVSSQGFDKDIRIEHENLNTGLNGDTVEVKLYGKRGGRITKVLTRAKKNFVGVLEKEKGHWFIVPDDRRMYVDILIQKPPKDIEIGEKALVKFLKWTDTSQDPIGEIVKVLGKAGEHEVEMQAIVLDRGIDTTFPTEVEKEARDIKKDWDKNAKQYIYDAIRNGTRRDFRETPTFTIDPHDAKDFDDALSIQKIDNRQQTPSTRAKLGTGQTTENKQLWEIGIHIADVSHFVQQGSDIDQEARDRGFSTYLVDRTIPMLPEELSNDLCSLNQDVDRLTFSAVFTLDENAKVHDRWFGKGVIHSRKRFSYEEAQDVLDGKNTTLATELTLLNTLAQKLRAERIKKGSIDFEQREIEIELDANNSPSRIYRKKLLDTNKLIEDFMLLANREVATYIFNEHKERKAPKSFLYRVHDLPNPEKIEQLSALLSALGYPALEAHGRGRKRTTTIRPQDINLLFEQIKGSSVETMIKTALIRSMAKAVYTTTNIGHFGLGFSYYTHFTSPIRRYPDLLVHRLLETHLDGSEVSGQEARSHTQLAWDLSQKEATIQQAERESIKYKQVQYMQAHVGETFDGIITGVTDWGIYVQETETGAEGLVKISDLKEDYFVFDEKRYRLVGKRTKKTYTLGDTTRVKVTSTNIDQRTIDFVLA